MTDGTTSNRYSILGRLATGGMADIFLAKVASMGGVERYVVLKRILAERGRDPLFAKMFVDEARLAAQLHHPNIAQVLDVGMLAGSYFFTMEYVHGRDVRQLLEQLARARQRMPINLVVQVAIGALSALHHAHDQTSDTGEPLGVVHRDVSPSNVMVSFDGAVKLLDFGVAKAAQRTQETRAGVIKGKIGYLSPEQCKGGEVDRRSDVFSFGIVLHEMLTGRRLYRAESDYDTMQAIIHEPVLLPSRVRPEISAELDAIVEKAVAKDPAARFATAAEMVEALEALAERERHKLSTRALGQLMRATFGECKEPWKDGKLGEVVRPVTITGESVVVLIGTPATKQLAAAEQLARAPMLQAPPPRARATWPTTVAIAIAAVALAYAMVPRKRTPSLATHVAPIAAPAPAPILAAPPTSCDAPPAPVPAIVEVPKRVVVRARPVVQAPPRVDPCDADPLACQK